MSGFTFPRRLFTYYELRGILRELKRSTDDLFFSHVGCYRWWRLDNMEDDEVVKTCMMAKEWDSLMMYIARKYIARTTPEYQRLMDQPALDALQTILGGYDGFDEQSSLSGSPHTVDRVSKSSRSKSTRPDSTNNVDCSTGSPHPIATSDGGDKLEIQSQESEEERGKEGGPEIPLQRFEEQKKTNKEIRQLEIDKFDSLRAGWEDEFLGDCAARICLTMAEAESTYNSQGDRPEDQVCAKVLPIRQSTGIGMSRAVDEVTKTIPGIAYIIRTRVDTAFPPSDEEIATMILHGKGHNLRPLRVGHFSDAQMFAYSLAVAFLGASIEMVTFAYREYARSHTGNDGGSGFAPAMHDQMMPVQLSKRLNPKESVSSRVSKCRSEVRKRRCRWVVKRMAHILDELDGDKAWIELLYSGPGGSDEAGNRWRVVQSYEEYARWVNMVDFEPESPHSFRRKLLANRLYRQFLVHPLEEAIETLPEQAGPEPRLVVAIDGETVIRNNARSGLFIPALHTILSGLNGYPFWVVTV